ncbi:ADP/ATP-dependent (S)-NAD(P)H-hydrate dehydratase [Microbacterium sp. cf332]|uniref:ADP-dependent NAD(P)H-hydrate dehydratase n=1 Tax=Microbacterium sp. cf332 TaxID=1761804 RepID=UPI0008873FBA|nr:ADP/ATP-dependent (S)-NAD(P)H-hydrate dehydratase [Microbacterium sp. cf332]SDQ80903.1 yjeF C-terminal region, hydroxyethylthiazole kinase-related [Microbacterium sp. cf332]
MVEIHEWDAVDTAALLRKPTADDHKYSRGVLGVRTGSQEYPGAAVLGVEAAWRTGIGMVRYLGPDRPADLVLQRRPETVTAPGRVQAWLIGSGTDATTRPPAETARLEELLQGDVPVVVDAGALDLVPGARAPLVVTPHRSEHARLRGLLGLDDTDATTLADRVSAARETAAAAGIAVLLKGAETVVAAPDGWSTVVRAGTGWLATAGTGDVLGGVLGSIVAARAADRELEAAQLARLAAAAAYIHGHAARAAAAGPITALDVAEAVPAVIGTLLSGGDPAR